MEKHIHHEVPSQCAQHEHNTEINRTYRIMGRAAGSFQTGLGLQEEIEFDRMSDGIINDSASGAVPGPICILCAWLETK
jgi:hypothetical protein